MTIEEVTEFLGSLRKELADLGSRVTSRGDCVFLRLDSVDRPTVWAEVSTRGNTWCSLALDGGFLRDVVDEDATDEQRRGDLRRLVQLGAAYVRGNVETRRSRWLREPIRVIHTDDESVEVRLTIDGTFRRALGR